MSAVEPCGCRTGYLCPFHRAIVAKAEEFAEGLVTRAELEAALRDVAEWLDHPSTGVSDRLTGERYACPICGQVFLRVAGIVWACGECDAMDRWPRLEGVRFYDQEADDA